MKPIPPNILLFGKNGQAGLALSKNLKALGNVTALGRAECDLCQPGSIRKIITSIRPNIIINAAAYNAVDQAETTPGAAYTVNTLAPRVMAESATELNALLVHYSSDYVFDGKKNSPYIESDQPNPLSVYGKSKWQAEEAIRQACPRHLILRTSWLYSVHGKNFLNAIFRLAKDNSTLEVVSDQIGTPTSVELLTTITQSVLQHYTTTCSLPYGTYHLVPHGGISRHGYARAIVQFARTYQLPVKLTAENIRAITTTQHTTTLAPRPTNSQLDNSLLVRTFGLKLPTWQEDVEQTIQQMASTIHD